MENNMKKSKRQDNFAVHQKVKVTTGMSTLIKRTILSPSVATLVDIPNF